MAKLEVLDRGATVEFVVDDEQLNQGRSAVLVIFISWVTAYSSNRPVVAYNARFRRVRKNRPWKLEVEKDQIVFMIGAAYSAQLRVFESLRVGYGPEIGKAKSGTFFLTRTRS